MTPRRAPARLLALAVLAALPPVALAGAGGKPPVPAPPTALPPAPTGIGQLAASRPWVIGARPGAASARLVRARGGRLLDAELGLWRVGAGRARPVAMALRARGLLRHAAPDVPARPAQAAPPAGEPAPWYRPVVVPAAIPPPAAPAAPVLGLVEQGVDGAHPDLTHVTLSGVPGAAVHGSAAVSVATGAANGIGTYGVWPGAPTRVYTDDGTCSGATAAVLRAARERVPVLNMSYGFPDGGCPSHLEATNHAYGLGTVLVASAGNSGDRDNPRFRPANDPHVLSVGAIDETLSTTAWSNHNTGIDLVAPGSRVPVARAAGDTGLDPAPFAGYGLADGTSFSAPQVAALAAWIRTARPGLSQTQADALLRRTAHDLGPAGWDERNGWGLPDLAAALAAPAPAHDPLEPNDDIRWVDGRHFAADPPLWRRARTGALRGRLDREKDPVDVYPVHLPRGAALRLVLTPVAADVDIEVFRPRARTVFYTRRPATLVTGSYAAGLRRDRVEVSNRGPATRVWVSVWIDAGQDELEAGYALRMTRVPLRAAAR